MLVINSFVTRNDRAHTYELFHIYSSYRWKFDSVDDTTSYTQLFSIVLRTLTSERRVSHSAPGWLPKWRTATTSFERKKQKAEKVGGARDKTMCVSGWDDGQETRGATKSRASARNGESDGGCILDEGTTVERMTTRISVVIRAARAFFFFFCRHARMAPKPLIKSRRRPIFPLSVTCSLSLSPIFPILSCHTSLVCANFLATRIRSCYCRTDWESQGSLDSD